MTPTYFLLPVFLIGVVAGLRSMTAPAVVCWGAHLGWLALAGSSLGFFVHPAALVAFTIFAVGELIADKLPVIPSRTTAGPLVVRLISGALSGAALCIAAHSAVFYGILLGAVGAIIGAYGGYYYRRGIPANNRAMQFLAALLEDVVAVCGGFWIVSRF
jgi:uncharacterized membrane protein